MLVLPPYQWFSGGLSPACQLEDHLWIGLYPQLWRKPCRKTGLRVRGHSCNADHYNWVPAPGWTKIQQNMWNVTYNTHIGLQITHTQKKSMLCFITLQPSLTCPNTALMMSSVWDPDNTPGSKPMMLLKTKGNVFPPLLMVNPLSYKSRPNTFVNSFEEILIWLAKMLTMRKSV